jgi:hypothetical protein
MSGIKVTVYTVKVRRFFLLGIIKVCIFSLFSQCCGEQIFMAMKAAAVINMTACIFKPSAFNPVE